ncbi:MAG: Rhamnosyl O-methyltransferase [Holosporales bacterium]
MTDKAFQKEREQSVHALKKCIPAAHTFSKEIYPHKYSYNFDWLGMPIIQYPQDMIALQEIVYKTKPTVIIETGIARGGSLIFYASLLKLLDQNGKVIGIDIDLRAPNRALIEAHPLYENITLIDGSSVDINIYERLKKIISPTDRVMVVLDSNHTHHHVREELDLYHDLVTPGCYLVVLDTLIEDLPDAYFNDRPWGRGNNPKTAVHDFLSTNHNFEIDTHIQNKLLLTAAYDGYLIKK